LSRVPGIEVVGECANGAETVGFIQEREIDLVLLDIRMPDYTGLDVVHQIGPDCMPMVIFITAYDEYAIQAFELNAVDYLLKPFDDERLIRSVERARERLAAKSQVHFAEQLRSLLAQSEQKQPERLAVRNKDGYDMVPVDAIDWIEAADNYVELHCGGRAHLLSETLTNLERMLNHNQFVRVHRGRIVNASRITKISPLANGCYELKLHSGVRLTTGRQYRATVTKLLLGKPA